MDMFFKVTTTISIGLALFSVSKDYLEADDKKTWLGGAGWWLAMYSMVLGPLFLTLYLLFTFG